LTSDDWAIWRDLRLRALADAPDAFGSILSEWEEAPEPRWRARLELPGSRNLVAYLDEKPAGMVTCAPFDGVHEVISMWVAREARGRGVGDALVDGACAWARVHGASELCLDVKESNVSALRLYRRHGFVEAGASRERGERRLHKEL